MDDIDKILREFAPAAEHSYYLKGQKPFYAVAEEDLPKLKAQLEKLINDRVISELENLMPQKKQTGYKNDGEYETYYFSVDAKVIEDRLAELKKGEE